jgi:DNA-binding XRE family transcriptional regulator
MPSERLKIKTEVVRRARILAGLSQQELAHKAGVAEQSVHNLFRGAAGLTVVRAVARALRLTMAQIVVFDDESTGGRSTGDVDQPAGAA